MWCSSIRNGGQNPSRSGVGGEVVTSLLWSWRAVVERRLRDLPERRTARASPEVNRVKRIVVSSEASFEGKAELPRGTLRPCGKRYRRHPCVSSSATPAAVSWPCLSRQLTVRLQIRRGRSHHQKLVRCTQTLMLRVYLAFQLQSPKEWRSLHSSLHLLRAR
jgi:hypothetical protein